MKYTSSVPASGTPPGEPSSAADAGSEPTIAAALAVELADLETRLYSDPRAAAARAAPVLALARAHNLPEEGGRARLIIADAASRSDDVAGAVDVARAVLIRARTHTVHDAYGALVVAARAQALLAWCLYRMGILGEAVAHAVEAVRLLPAAAPLHLQVDHTMTLALLNGAHSPDDRYIDAFEHVLAQAEQLDNTDLLLITLNNYAWLHHIHRRPADARPLIARIQTVSRSRKAVLSSTILDTISSVLLDLGDLDGAETVARSMIDPAVPDTEARAKPEALLTLARIRAQRGALRESLDLVSQAERIAIERRVPEMIAMATEQKADLLAELDDPASAFQALKLSHTTWKEVYNREAADRATTLHALFETEQAHQRSVIFEQLAEHDALTGLWNRRHIDRVLPHLLSSEQLRQGALSIAIIDVDHFKHLNDSRSHLTGDAVLVRLGELLTQVVPKPGFTARLGGEEFLLTMPETGPVAALALCETTRRLVQDERWSALTDGLAVTVSVGFATTTAGSTMSTLLRAADEALYRAKNTGRNRVNPTAVALDEAR